MNGFAFSALCAYAKVRADFALAASGVFVSSDKSA
jgi:hypothetical protein